MAKELLINATSEGAMIALVKDKQLIELHREYREQSYSVGDIYLGRIKKIMPGLNAAFVDVGYSKDAFLHYFDLGPNILSLLKLTNIARRKKNFGSLSLLHKLTDFGFEQTILKNGQISDVLNKNTLIPVQVAKEPISTKGPRLSSEISLPGRYIVLVPFSNNISISKKIKNISERQRLKTLVENIRPENFGIIVRTVSQNKEEEDIKNELNYLLEKWTGLVEKLSYVHPGKKIAEEIDRSSSILRDVLSSDFQQIVVDDTKIFDEVKSYIRSIAPEQEKIVRQYKGETPLYEYFGIDRQIKSLFGRIVNLQGGIYLIIERTEAMHVIDVNSGNRNAREGSQEENALQVNMDAAKEVARQLRLRDLGGIIVVDFIDMHKTGNQKALYNFLKSEMAGDRAKHTILPPSKFGLVQITRQRVRPELKVDPIEKCPACNGTGKIKASIVLVDDIENNLKYVLSDYKGFTGIILRVHPYIYAYIISKGILFKKIKWFFKYNKWVKIMPVNSYSLTEYHFFDSKGEEISL